MTPRGCTGRCGGDLACSECPAYLPVADRVVLTVLLLAGVVLGVVAIAALAGA